ncbi:MAG: NAD(P) transhydrogenase subunit alpha [Moraxellaceae bacterium]|jgi:NAD(P) transhydrogenase subunit alpha|nr:NAD(P) transhydrogenase subunit alpha [Moraxellaceae bacterium]MBP7229826.1 NAD(P) transhydrogenase subunit alpha [Moraxellaceae bacterium]MBP8851878.1 NAD(P) transhydrogenase subunit alpha [Moraxellaceae bacterium]MBP9045812.1 NAD(P) transhydrogenase subunit alpha [Moraxellaceae bacterium]MBP9729936.1 NAD(P) transhydrogenase subunit alpha [Moraxellaceae bacterium]
MQIGIPAEILAGETRVAATPETVKKFVALGYKLVVQSGAGIRASCTDKAYEEAGATIAATAADAVKDADVVFKVAGPTADEVVNYKQGAIVLAAFAPHLNTHLDAYAAKGLTCVAMELIPRISRAQSSDILSSQASLAGYKAVLIAANEYSGMFPMMMTAAGTIKPARCVILGVGVAGLQAIATAKRLGGVVEASDMRPAAKEQVESLGGKWLDVPMSDEEKAKALGTGGYAWTPSAEYVRDQAVIVDKAVSAANIVITTAQIPGRKAPVLIKAETVAKMKAGAVIVDMAVSSGGNVEGSKLDEIVITENGVRIVGIGNIPATVATEASALYSRNIFNFLQPQHDKESQSLKLNREDEMVKPTLIVDNGQVLYKKP